MGSSEKEIKTSLVPNSLSGPLSVFQHCKTVVHAVSIGDTVAIA
jgi:hypothetical protein